MLRTHQSEKQGDGYRRSFTASLQPPPRDLASQAKSHATIASFRVGFLDRLGLTNPERCFVFDCSVFLYFLIGLGH